MTDVADDVVADEVTECVDCEENNLPIIQEEIPEGALKKLGSEHVVDTSVAAATPTKYAPVIAPVRGNINLYCIALQWQDDPGSSLASTNTSGLRTKQTYRELSGRLIEFHVVSRKIKVPYNKAAKNIPAAEKYAKAKMPKPNNDFRTIYVIVNHGAKNFSNAGGDTAHLYGTLTRDFLHEVGHLRPFGLGHSGKYVNGKLEAYGDGTSFMGRFSSSKLTGAQLYLLGWLPEKQVGLYDIGDAPTEFNICSLYADEANPNMKVVLIPRGNQRPLYISMPKVSDGKHGQKSVLMLHLSSGKGTQRVAVFGNAVTYEGLLFEKTGEVDGVMTVRVTTIAQ